MLENPDPIDFSSVVPVGVPSLDHSSAPLVPSLARPLLIVMPLRDRLPPEATSNRRNAVLPDLVIVAPLPVMLTDPVTVANAVDEGEISPLVRQLAQILYNAVAGLLQYL